MPRAKTFTPTQAMQIAARFRRIAADIRIAAGDLRQIGSTLESDWEGESQRRFVDEYRPSNLESYATWLEDAASRLESISVTTWETPTTPELDP